MSTSTSSFIMHSSKGEHHLFVNSSDSSVYFPFNGSCDFQIELGEALHLTGRWTCALAQIAFKEEISEDIIILSDLIDGSFIRDTRLPVLRVIPQSTEKVFVFPEPFRFTISRDDIKRFRVFIRTGDLREPSFIQKPVTCTLHLRRE